VTIPPAAVAFPDGILRPGARRVADVGVGIRPVAGREDPTRLVGLGTACEPLRARQRLAATGRDATRVLILRGRRARTGVGAETRDGAP